MQVHDPRSRAFGAIRREVPILNGRWEPSSGPERRTGMLTSVWRRPVVLGALAVVTACSGSTATSAKGPNAPTASSSSGSTTQATPLSGVSASFRLSTNSSAGGTVIPAMVTVRNSTGRPLSVTGCKSLFLIILRSDRLSQQAFSPACAEQFTISAGESNYPVQVETRYLTCSQGAPQGATSPSCLADGSPPLPTGEYDAVLFAAFKLDLSPPQKVKITSPSRTERNLRYVPESLAPPV